MPQPNRSGWRCANRSRRSSTWVSPCTSLPAALAQPAGAAHFDATELAALMRQAVTRLQFYDRMTQHLSHVQDYLLRSAHQMGRPQPEAGWTGVHQQLSDRLLSDTQRFHLGKNFQDGLRDVEALEGRNRGARSEPGDIDLF